MILVDTSVWIDHLHERVPALLQLLEHQSVATHPYVIGELACGNIRSRAEVLAMLKRLPTVVSATDANALALIELRSLMRRGIAYSDVHLLASTAISEGVKLWTRDKRLLSAADAMGLAFRG